MNPRSGRLIQLRTKKHGSSLTKNTKNPQDSLIR